MKTALRMSSLVCALVYLCAASAAAQRPEIDFSAWLAANGSHGTVKLSNPAYLDHAAPLPDGTTLVIAAPLRFSGGASLRLLGHNQVKCTAPLTTDTPTTIFVADQATDVHITGCNAQAKTPGGFLFEATRSANVSLTGSNVTDMGLFVTHNAGGAQSQTTNVTVTGSSSTFPKGSGAMGVYLAYVLHAVVSNNHFTGNDHGVEMWGGDANAGWHGFAAVVNAGDLTATGNTCTNMREACIWGSVSRDLKVFGNTADGCGDVCFDTEGGVNNVFTKNVAHHCGFGCYAAEFESQGAVFSSNQSDSDSGHAMVLIKHGSGNPSWHENLLIENNTFTCTKVICPAIYTEGEDGLFFTHNTVINGVVANVNYHNDIHITGNTFRFTVDLAGGTAISGPAIFNHHTSEISDNLIVNEAKSTKPATCIGQDYSDYNNVDEMRILRNTCRGFDVGIATSSSGQNPGAPRAVWTISGNHVSAAQPYVHRHTSGNETYNFAPDNTQKQGLP